VGEVAQHGEPAPDRIGAGTQSFVGQRLPGGEGLDAPVGEEAAEQVGGRVGVPLAGGDDQDRHAGARLRRRERGGHQRLHGQRGGDVEPRVAGGAHHARHAGVGEDDVEHAAQGH
jgi:hypothetical protein